MTEQEKPGFTVVDRRSSAQPDSARPEAASPETESAAPTTPAPTQEVEADATHADSSRTSDSAASDETQEPESALPDPALIVGLASMQMDTRELALTLFGVFDSHAWRALGLIADPKTGETKTDLPTAQLAIDCVQFLLSKIEADLPDSQRREAQRRLNDLRMNYLAKAREASTT